MVYAAGTEVRKKRGNFMIGELLQPGDSLVVARGGRGGLGVVAPSREQKIRKAVKARSRAVSAAGSVWLLVPLRPLI